MKFLPILFACVCSLSSIPVLQSVPRAAVPTIVGRAPISETPLLTEASLFDRIVVVGASLSAGFGLEAETKTATSFADVLNATINAEHGRVSNQAQSVFFIDPDGYGRLMIDQAKKLKPTLVIAVDFPFWFGYGSLPEEERLGLAKRGLSLLDEIECPIVVGNYPDMTEAIDGGILSVIQVPNKETLAALNSLIGEWITKRPKRYLVDIAEHVELIRASKDILVGSGWKGARVDELMQADRLHPTVVGSAVMAVMIAEELLAGDKTLPVNSFDLEIESIAKRVQSAALAD